MAEPKDIAAKLMAEGFRHAGPAVESLTDPIVETPMVVTLDQLEAYDLDPRVTRNPLYEQIKASIRERSLDTPPPITRRPGAARFMIRNGGNTRLRILRELWTETRDEKFYRICCLFRPWTERGEITVLTGHLAENELRGGLSFIERAMGVAKARELYQQESAEPLTQSELARKLSADGYPITQTQISRMQDTVEYLLPAIPTVLYAGLGRPQIERLRNLRKASARAWERGAESLGGLPDFQVLFRDVLAQFDHAPGEFDVQRVRDELLGQMAQLLRRDYDELALQLFDAESWVKTMLHHVPSELAVPLPDGMVEQPVKQHRRDTGESSSSSASRPPRPSSHDIPSPVRPSPPTETASLPIDASATPSEPEDYLEISSAVAPPRPSSESYHPYTITSIRVELAQLATDVASSIGGSGALTTTDNGLGFTCSPGNSGDQLHPAAAAVLNFLEALSAPARGATPRQFGEVDLSRTIAPLLIGTASEAPYLSDDGLDRLVTLIRAARKYRPIATSSLP